MFIARTWICAAKAFRGAHSCYLTAGPQRNCGMRWHKDDVIINNPRLQLQGSGMMSATEQAGSDGGDVNQGM